jgi:hypothetical protein
VAGVRPRHQQPVVDSVRHPSEVALGHRPSPSEVRLPRVASLLRGLAGCRWEEAGCRWEEAGCRWEEAGCRWEEAG